MRKLFRINSGPLILLSILSFLAIGSYVLWKSGCAIDKKDVGGKTQKQDGGSSGTPKEDSVEPSNAANEQAADLRNDLPDDKSPAGVEISDFREPQPLNGTVFIKPESGCVVPLSVEAKGLDNYYIHLKYIIAPENPCTAARTGPGETRCADIGFFLTANSSVSLKVPVGTYSFAYAAGDCWYGLEKKFGPDTHYFKSDEPLTFSVDKNLLYGNTVQLFPLPDGSSSNRQIDPAEFPG